MLPGLSKVILFQEELHVVMHIMLILNTLYLKYILIGSYSVKELNSWMICCQMKCCLPETAYISNVALCMYDFNL